MNSPKVLVATPFYDKKIYCFENFVNNVNNFSYPNFDFLVIDNSADHHIWKYLLEKYKIWIEHVNRASNTQQSLLASCQKIRSIFLEKDYDYLFFLECDLFPRENIIQHLLKNNKKVCSATYFLLSGNHQYPKVPCAVTNFSPETTFLNPWEIDGTLKECKITGLGCQLIHREVVETIKFRCTEKVFPDCLFHLDIKNHGYKSWLDTSIVVEHQQGP